MCKNIKKPIEADAHVSAYFHLSLLSRGKTLMCLTQLQDVLLLYHRKRKRSLLNSEALKLQC